MALSFHVIFSYHYALVFSGARLGSSVFFFGVFGYYLVAPKFNESGQTSSQPVLRSNSGTLW